MRDSGAPPPHSRKTGASPADPATLLRNV